MVFIIDCLYEQLEVLEIVPGIGKVVSKVLLAFLPEIGKVVWRQIASLVGVAPHPMGAEAASRKCHLKSL